MSNSNTSFSIAVRLWLYSALFLSTGIFIYALFTEGAFSFLILIASIIVTTTGSLPAYLVLVLLMPLIKKLFRTYTNRVTALIFLFFIIAAGYGFLGGLIDNNPFSKYSSLDSFFRTMALCSASVFASIIAALIINIKYIKNYFLPISKNIHAMEENLNQPLLQSNQPAQSNKLWVKGLITGALILIMLIPTVFVSNLVEERQERQQEVKTEVSSKWASAQNITFPYLYIPYTVSSLALNGKPVVEKKSFIILPENLNVNGSVTTEQRKRSIYSVLLYNSSLVAKGNFNIQIPEGVDAATINWNDAKICLGISDFKGIQQKITAVVNNANYDLSAGIPTNEIDSTGLSSSIVLNADNINKQLSFELPLKIKGSDQLHFVPLAGNSQFDLKSNWNSPSFDGNNLPNERSLDNSGFEATWNFNKANLPFTTVLKNFNFKKDDYAFGVSLLQPADQYAKTMRCVKYAILFIGLSFSLFFIVEIMQKKPFHPVQYVLVGLALIVFYTLLLSISEFLLFDTAYLIAAFATVSLITLYAKSHFKSWKTAGIFSGVIGSIYAFIFVLIRLEDTALLVGSIGLFVILALAMYASRKINWYGNTLTQKVSI
jgi:inner membrane protein